jgi:hypothetical protein
MDGADQALRAARVADRLAGRGDTAAERRLRHDSTLPHGLDQLVAAHGPVTVAHQVDQDVEYLRLDVNRGAGAPQLVPCQVDFEIGEAEVQGSPDRNICPCGATA